MPTADSNALLANIAGLPVATAEPSSLYAAAKAISQLTATSGPPRSFVNALRDRLQSAEAASDPGVMAYMAKAMADLDGYNLINGAWYTYGGALRGLNWNKPLYNLQNSDLAVPSGLELITSSTNVWRPSGGVPYWWNDNTLLRVRGWGGGGSGATGRSGQSGGAGGSYAELLVPWGTLKNTSFVVGLGGDSNNNNGSPGFAGGFSRLTANGVAYATINGGTGGYYNQSSNTPGNGNSFSSKATGSDVDAAGNIYYILVNSIGGQGGYTTFNSTQYSGGTGGGAAAGPWGTPPPSGGLQGGTYVSTGGAGTGGGSLPNTGTATPGGISTAYVDLWKSTLLSARLGGAVGAAGTSSVAPGSGGPGAGGGGAVGNTSFSNGGSGGVFAGGGGGAYQSSSGAGGGAGGMFGGGGGGGGYWNSSVATSGGAGGNGGFMIEYVL